MKNNACIPRLPWLFLLLLMLSLHPALAAESAGVILAFSGKVELQNGADKRLPSHRGELYNGDTIVTGDGQIQIRFIDGTLLTLYRDTRFSVDDYRYGKSGGDRAQFSLINGLMHTLTGQIDKQGYLLKTRLANLGVRGTDYSARLGDTLHVSVNQGSVVVTNAGGSIQIGAGKSASVAGPNAMPRPSSSKVDVLKAGGEGGGRHGEGGGKPPPPPPGAPQGSRPPPPPPGTQHFSDRPPPGQPAPGQKPPAGLPPPTGAQPATGLPPTTSPPPAANQPAPTGTPAVTPPPASAQPPTGTPSPTGTPPSGTLPPPPGGKPPPGSPPPPPPGGQPPPPGAQPPPQPKV